MEYDVFKKKTTNKFKCINKCDWVKIDDRGSGDANANKCENLFYCFNR